MPALPPAANVIRITLIHTYSSDVDVVVRLFMLYSGTPPTNAQLNTFCTSVGTAWNTDLAPMCPNVVTLTAVDAVDLTSATSAVGAAAVSHAGSRGTSFMGAQVAALINFKIARRYRGGKPRVYLPAGVDGDIATAQTWTGAFLTAMNTAWGNFITAIEAAVWAGGTLSGQANVSFYNGYTNYVSSSGRYKTKNDPRVGSAVVDPITSFATNIKIGTQRRRVNA